jgi:hypothetical protein
MSEEAEKACLCVGDSIVLASSGSEEEEAFLSIGMMDQCVVSYERDTTFRVLPMFLCSARQAAKKLRKRPQFQDDDYGFETIVSESHRNLVVCGKRAMGYRTQFLMCNSLFYRNMRRVKKAQMKSQRTTWKESKSFTDKSFR